MVVEFNRIGGAMKRTKPNLNIFLLIAMVTVILTCDVIASYLGMSFPATLVVYGAGSIPMYFLSRMIRRKLQKRNAENE
jgi:hypothetical protein